MADEKRYSIIGELQKCSDYDIALLTTFNFEMPYFERAVLPILLSGGVRKISLFIDAGEFSKSLQEVDVGRLQLGRKYIVNPVRIRNSFHPKIILLLGEKKAKLIVGSANIKTSGYSLNHEIFNYIEYSREQPEYLDAIVDAINFFRSINEQSYQLDNAILQEAVEYSYYHRVRRNEQLHFLHNMKESILSQVRGIINAPVDEIRVAVPYYDNKLAALIGIAEAYPDAKLYLYIQKDKSTFSVPAFQASTVNGRIVCFDGFTGTSTEMRNNFYHGKVMLFKTQTEAYILYGSVNCTQAALMKSFTEDGNIECDLLEKGSRSEFDSFFSKMNIIPDTDVTGSLMIFQAQENTNFFYKYGELKEQLILYIGFAEEKSNLKVSIGEQDIGYLYRGDELIVQVPDDLREILPDIFPITLTYEGRTEELRCWVINIPVLLDNRAKQSEQELLSGFDINSDGERFKEDRINLLKAEMTCFQELQEHNKKLAHFNQIRLEQEGDDSEKEDYIVDIQIPDEYREEYRKYTIVSKVRGLFLRQFILRNIGFLDRQADKKTSEETEDTRPRISLSQAMRKATTEEKRFERFVKGKVRGMLNDRYVEIIEPEHYIGLMDVVLGIFKKYHEEEKIEDIFPTEYVVSTRSLLLIKALSKKDPVSEELSRALIMQGFHTLYDNYREREAEIDLDRQREYDEISRNLLLALEAKHHIRSGYEEYVLLLLKQNETIDPTSVKTFMSYIEKLFDYKSFDMLSEYIGSLYNYTEVSISGKTLNIKATSTDMFLDGKPNLQVLREIDKFSRNDTPIEYVNIQIDSVAPNPENKNIIVQNIHKINLMYRKWTLIQIRKNGSKTFSKPAYINY